MGLNAYRKKKSLEKKTLTSNSGNIAVTFTNHFLH